MVRISTEIPAAEMPESLARLVPGGAMVPGARFRVTVELLGDDVLDEGDFNAVFAAVAMGVADVEAGRVVAEDTLFNRLIDKHSSNA